MCYLQTFTTRKAEDWCETDLWEGIYRAWKGKLVKEYLLVLRKVGCESEQMSRAMFQNSVECRRGRRVGPEINLLQNSIPFLKMEEGCNQLYYPPK